MTFTTVTIVPARVLWGVTDGLALEALLILFALCIYAVLCLRGTTLRAPAAWAVISTAALLLVAIRPDVSAAARFAVAATTFCPLMAVLGAKRPQDKGWQFVVATLWLVLVWPAAQAHLMYDGKLQLFVAWKLFVVGLIALGPLNYLATRNWFSSLLVAVGQTALLCDFLWQAPPEWRERQLPVAALCFLIAAALAARPSNATPAGEALAERTGQWLKFRDAYGAFWALRVLGRVNETAGLRRWPMRLTWQGFEIEDDTAPTKEQLVELDQALGSLLRRFVRDQS